MTKLSKEERALVDQVSAEHLEDYVINITRKVRLSGSPEERETFRYIARTLEAWGFEIEEHHPECWTSWPWRPSWSSWRKACQHSLHHALDGRLDAARGCRARPRGRGAGGTGVAGETAGERTGRPLRRPRHAGQGLPGRAGRRRRADSRVRRAAARDDHLHRLGSPTPENASLLPTTPSCPSMPRAVRGSATRWPRPPSASACAPRWTRAGVLCHFSSRISARRAGPVTSSS